VTALRRLTACFLLACVCYGCGDNPAGAMRDFQTAWNDAVNFREDEKLFFMLDTESQRRLRQDLERLRGLDPVQQRQVINKLGGERVDSLAQVTPEQYFRLLWNRVTQGRRPLMKIREHDDSTGYMILTLDGVDQEIHLSYEGGRWVWRLPAQTVGFDSPPPLSNGPPPAG